jgi:hypothetical protein
MAMPASRPTTHTVTIPARFNGPPETANGGYACGLVAQFIDGPAEVTLRKPPPLDEALQAVATGEGLSLYGGRDLIATGKSSQTALEVPAPPTLDEARAAAQGYRWKDGGHPYPTCFVCGPDRPHDDGLHIYPDDVEGRGLIATDWTPAADLADDEGNVRPEFVWSALDCPGGIAVMLDQPGRSLLGRLTAELHAPVRAGEEHVVIGWAGDRDGRKLAAGTAVFSADGELLAQADAVWIEV